MATTIAKRKNWYTRSVSETLSLLDTDAANGLTPEAAAERLKQYGPNQLPEGEKRSLVRTFLRQFNNILIYVLLVAAGITFFMGHYVDTAVILAVVVINAMIGFIQENRAESAMNSIRTFLSPEAHVVRGGKRMEIPAEDLTLGDVVRLKPGDKVPADLRLIQADNLRIEESPLTGEAMPAEKSIAPLPTDTQLGDRANIAFSGSNVSAGTGIGLVVAVGESTVLGRINEMLPEVETPTTPLIRQMDKLSTHVAIVIIVVAVGVYLFGTFFRDYERGELALSVMGLAIAAIPEGLPAIMSIILAVGVQAMARRCAIVRNLPSVESLGSVTVICSDKTGTLTQNEMTVGEVVTREDRFAFSGSGYSPEGEVTKGGGGIHLQSEPELLSTLTCFRVCNDSELAQDESGGWTVKGEPTEGALMTAYEKVDAPDQDIERLHVIPFDSAYKYMAVLAKVGGKKIIYIKGAPDRLFEMASEERNAGGTHSLDLKYWKKEMSRLAGEGQRTIAAAYKPASEGMTAIDYDDIKEGVILLGLAGITDPPRPEAIKAVEECQDAGITVKMITGDHAETATAIAEQMGICYGEEALTGRELDAMDEDDLRIAAQNHNVFARTSPENKLQLVKALQSKGEVVAMTGDGVNDAPALKMADVGIAMGVKGTEVTKEASEIVLADDNFSTIAAAVEEGRKVYDNIKKTILFILPTNGAECLLIMASIIFGTMLPLTPVQILWVNMVTSVTVSLALAFEPLDPEAMQRAPRDPSEGILTPYFIWRIFYVSVLIGGGTLWLGLALARSGSYDTDAIRTITMETIVIAQFFHLFNNRSLRGSALSTGFFSNKAVFIVGALMVALQLAVTYIPFMNTVFHTTPLPLSDWWYPMVLGLVVFVVVEIEKGIMRTLDARRMRRPVRARNYSNTTNMAGL
ncbi:MAG: cation-transporting P-type ATPase [Planctomycetaceae bacterium]|nr:cation-transporting P-type ATPase [Planctomycetaceae bacterium]